MQGVSLFYLALFAATPFTVVAHHPHSHHKPSGYKTDHSNPTSYPLASGTGNQPFPSLSAPYPAGNGTNGGSTSAGSQLSGNAIISTVQSTIYVTSPEDTASGGFGGTQQVASFTGIPLSLSPSGPNEGASLCGPPAIVTVTGETITITETSAVSSSQTLSQSQSSAASRASTQSSASSQSSFSADPIASETAIPTQSPTSLASIAEKLAIQPVSSQVAASSGSISAVVSTSPTAAASNLPITPSSISTNSNTLTPNGKKAGVAGYQSITEKASWSQFTSHIGWYSDYWPNTPDSGSVTGIGMVSKLRATPWN